MKYVVDANVLSELTKPTPSPSVIAWLRRHEADLAVTPIVLGEIEYGILLVPTGKRRARLMEWFEAGVARMRVLDFDTRTGSAWAQLLAKLKKKGTPMAVKDSLIAASALAHGLAVSTRDENDFKHAGVDLVNPFA